MIYLIRHGESASNAGERTENPFDIDLTERGKKQAIDLANSIDKKPDLVVVSPFFRTRQTAQPLIDKFPDVPIEQWEIQEFTFLDTKKCSNTNREERLNLRKEYLQRNDPDYIDGEGAESFNQMVARVDKMFEKLKEIDDDKFVVIFTHGFFMGVVLMKLLNREVELLELFKGDINTIPNCSIIKIENG